MLYITDKTLVTYPGLTFRVGTCNYKTSDGTLQEFCHPLIHNMLLRFNSLNY